MELIILRKGNRWLRLLIQGMLIVLIMTLLVIFYRQIQSSADQMQRHSYAAALLAAIPVCCIAIVAVQLFFTRKDTSRARSERDETLMKLKEKAQTDALTGLLNREEAVEEITAFLNAEGRNHCHTLLMIDLDNFKNINDNFGHFEGDKVLKLLASSIKSVFRNIDIVGRLGGDEFIVLMKHTSTKSIVRRKALELRAALEYMAGRGETSVTVTGSIGISTYDGDGKTFETLYKEADEALYRAKLGGKNRYSYFKDAEAEEQADQAGETSKTVLKESGAFIQLQALIDNIDGGIALLEIDAEIRAIFLSHSYIRLMHMSEYGAESDDKVFDFVHSGDIDQVEETLRRGASSGEPVEAVFRRITESGATFWYHIRAVRIQYEDSVNPVLIAIVTDVTNLKMTELNNQAQKKQLETVLRISRVVTFEVDIASRTLFIADPTVAKYGIDVHSIANMPESLIEGGAIHPDSFEECRRMYDEIYAGIPEGSAIIRTLKRDGQYTIERFTYFTVYDESGRPVKAVGVDEGMETQSAAHLRVDLIERQYKVYSENMLTIVKVVVEEDSFAFLKPEEIPEETRGQLKTYTDLLEYRTADIVEPVDRALVRKKFGIDSLRMDHSDRGVLSYEYKVRNPDGAVRWHTMSVSAFFDQFDGRMYSFIRTQDTTFRRNLEQSLGEKSNRELTYGNIYTLQLFGRLTDAYIRSRDRKSDCAIMLFSVRNVDYMLEQHGRIMLNDMLGGFVGKILMVIDTDHLSYYDSKNTMAVFVPAAVSAAALTQLAEKILKLLRNPAYFQFHEEVFMDFSCGISVSDEKTPGFAELYSEALKALRVLDEQTDRHIVFS
jgi:diguanylate cyclase (GGDEF)-like protein/PAS domain S-box-containing protein